MAPILDKFLNPIREAASTPLENNARKEVKIASAILKVASVVVAVVNVFFFTVFPSLFTFATASLFIFLAREGYVIGENIREINDSAITELWLQLNNNDEATLEHICKGTFVVRPIVDFMKAMLDD